MNTTDEIVLNIVKDTLGDCRKTKETNPQKYFNCRSNKCRHDHDKFNLAYHAESKVFKCWKCNIRGNVYSLIKYFGNKNLLEKLELILPYYNNAKSFFSKNIVDYDSVICELPKEYKPLWIKSDTFKYKSALNYVLNDRHLTMEQIVKYKIGYTEDGPKKLRIIIPSYNKNGDVNYYEARSYYDKIKQSYVKPDYPDKDDIVFNEKFINYDLTVFLVEGFFDSVRIPNSIPLLGKTLSPLIIMKLLKHNSRVVICLDEDALKDSYQIFNTLNSLGLDVYYIDMKGYDDVSKTYENKGEEGIKELMNKISKFDIKKFLENNLNYQNNE